MTNRRNDSGTISLCLLGASLRTGNLGVNAITESTVSCVRRRWPGAQLVIVGTNAPLPPEESIECDGETVTLPVFKFFDLHKRLDSPDHVLQAAVSRGSEMIMPASWHRRLFTRKTGPAFTALSQSDLVLDASSGDGFTDLYGTRRFYREAVRKWLVLTLGKRLVLLPQTIGPFRNPVFGAVAGHIIRRARYVFVRDAQSLETARNFVRHEQDRGKIQLVPDLAFALDAPQPSKSSVVSSVGSGRRPEVGLNVSGLLLNDPPLRQFGLKSDYGDTVYALIEEFVCRQDAGIVLVPHVFGNHRESDETACRTILSRVPGPWRDRIRIATDRTSSAVDAKTEIRGLDFFVGARMHACIAALSQGIPALGLAYSDKFTGVFDTVGLEDCVADLRNLPSDRILELARSVYGRRQAILAPLAQHALEARSRVLRALDMVHVP